MDSSLTVEIAKALVAFDSVSSKSNEDVSHWVEKRLRKAGFEIERIVYRDGSGISKVNLVAKRAPATSGSQTGGVCYLAHTDVVPADDWSLDFCGPFQPTLRNERLYGRGSCDMKGSLACALAAAEQLSIHDQRAPLYFVVTADEEIGMIGARHVDSQSSMFQEMVAGGTIGIVGEPTLLQVIHAHKGGLALRITSRGRSAHSSSRDGINANHRLIPLLNLLLEIQQQCENAPHLQNRNFDPPTLSWNIVLRNEPFASNVTPSLAEAVVFLRPMPNVDHESLVARVQQEAAKLGLEFQRGEQAHPLSVPPSSDSVTTMLRLTGQDRSSTVCYATDGGVLQRLKQLVVCGPGSIEQAHRSDEWISVEQLARGTDLYWQAFRHWTL
jgi:acetylornithine deacetylase